MPEWMLVKAAANHPDLFKSSQPLALVRKDAKRMFLIDKKQPEKSSFSFMDFRHNVPDSGTANAEMSKALNNNIKRLCEWPEQVSKQSYDKKITPKIGSLAF